MLDKRTLSRINARPRGRGRAVYVAPGTLAVAAAAALLLSYAVGAVVLLAGAAGVFLLHRRDAEARTTRLTYDLGGETAARLASVREACEALADARKVWRVEEDAQEPGASSSYGVELSFDAGTPRHPVEVGPMEMPGISTNVEIWGIKTGVASLFFLPEGVLLYKEDLYRAVSYDSLGTFYRPARYAEDGEVPEDAEVVGETWQYVKADGSPDIRYPQNPRYAIVLYGLLSVTGTTPGIRLLVSNKAAAVRFARIFGSGQSEERSQARGDAGTAREERARRWAEAETERLSSLLKVLGVEFGASQKDIDTAYKRKAKTYHPDRAASLAPEVREMAELRMKEINAAYTELRRRAR